MRKLKSLDTVERERERERERESYILIKPIKIEAVKPLLGMDKEVTDYIIVRK